MSRGKYGSRRCSPPQPFPRHRSAVPCREPRAFPAACKVRQRTLRWKSHIIFPRLFIYQTSASDIINITLCQRFCRGRFGVWARAKQAVSRQPQHVGMNNETTGLFFISAVGAVGDAELCRQRCPPYVSLSLSSHGSLPKMNDSSSWAMKSRHCSERKAEKAHLGKGEEDLGSSCFGISRAPPVLQPSETSCKRNQDGLSTQR